jgi:hypothetical protein
MFDCRCSIADGEQNHLYRFFNRPSAIIDWQVCPEHNSGRAGEVQE